MTRRPGTLWMRLALAGMAFYVVYVIAGKSVQVAGAELPLKLGDTGEFLLVLATMSAFVIGLLVRERAASRTQSQPGGGTP